MNKRSKDDEDERNNMKRKHHSLTTITTSPLLSLSEETLIHHIISYSLPSKECQQWEWIGVLSQTCRTLRPIAQSLAPSRLFLKDFLHYETCCVPNSTASDTIDAREGILQTLCDFGWKRSKLIELHVNGPSTKIAAELMWTPHEGIRTLLRALITTPLPNLKWLDIELENDEISDYNLVDVECLQRMPSALPNLQQLCLGNCFVDKRRGFAPNVLKHFFDSLQKPLVSLSLGSVQWLTDNHVEVIMPSIGKHLTRLELAECGIWVDEDPDLYAGYELINLADRSLISIANSCQKLESFTITESDITSAGLRAVLSNNRSITTLNLSENKGLDTTVTGLISQYLPRLRVLRSYWSDSQGWLTDDGFIALLDAQERESGGLGISLEVIGLYQASSDNPLTIRGLKYAIEKGLQVIEIDKGAVHDLIMALKSNTKLYQPHYTRHYYMDGSHHEREK